MRSTTTAVSACTSPWGQNCEGAEDHLAGHSRAAPRAAPGTRCAARHPDRQRLAARPRAGPAGQRLRGSPRWRLAGTAAVLGAGRYATGRRAAGTALVAGLPGGAAPVPAAGGRRTGRAGPAAERRQRRQRADQPADAETAAEHRTRRSGGRQLPARRQPAGRRTQAGGPLAGRRPAHRLADGAGLRPGPGAPGALAAERRLALAGRSHARPARSRRQAVEAGRPGRR